MLTHNRILLVDDDPDDRELFTEVLLRINPDLEIHTASSGAKALSMMETMQSPFIPDLLIIDYNLGDMTGAEVLRKVKSFPNFSGVTRGVLSTSGLDYYRESCKEEGAQFYYQKPSSYREVMKIANLILTQSR